MIEEEVKKGILSRRYLRVKVLQALYAYQSSNRDLATAEKNMFKSVEDIADLYLYMLLLVCDVTEMARREIERNKEKKLPTKEDLNPNLKFVENKYLLFIENNIQFKKEVDRKKISWAIESDNVKKLWKQIKESKEYAKYMTNPQRSFAEDKNFAASIFRNYIAVFEVLHEFLEDRSIYWYNDLSVVCQQVLKNIQQSAENDNEHTHIVPPLYKDPESDIPFIKDLLAKVVLREDELSSLIDEYTANWELDRIAKLDVILMKMALCELMYFPSIPIKVTLNEYIDIAKDFSTPNSHVFINGVLDKISEKLKKENKIVKTGRGLL